MGATLMGGAELAFPPPPTQAESTVAANTANVANDLFASDLIILLGISVK
ncbi:MAG: hypothetical protein Q4C87_09400 [Actinomycetaceae bacterium]|nr:hypothetical protein [Actinomycetaceae bacterium]